MAIVPRYQVKLVRSGCERYEARRIKSSSDAQIVCEQVVRGILEDSPQEHFLVITLDTKNKPIGVHTITTGTLDASLVHPREVFTPALLSAASSVILCHNHPSGDLEPSRQDIEVTRTLRKAGEILGIRVLDHIIVGTDPDTDEWKSQSLVELGH